MPEILTISVFPLSLRHHSSHDISGCKGGATSGINEKVGDDFDIYRVQFFSGQDRHGMRMRARDPSGNWQWGVVGGTGPRAIGQRLPCTAGTPLAKTKPLNFIFTSDFNIFKLA